MLSFAFLFGVITWLCLIGGGIYLIVSGRRVNRLPPTCGNCGYNLTQSTANRCPECGELFINAGVVTSRRSGNRVGIGIAMVVLGVVPGLCSALSVVSFFQARSAAQQARAVAAQQVGRTTVLTDRKRYFMAVLQSTHPLTVEPITINGRPGRRLTHSVVGGTTEQITITDAELAKLTQDFPELAGNAAAYQAGLDAGYQSATRADGTEATAAPPAPVEHRRYGAAWQRGWIVGRTASGENP